MLTTKHDGIELDYRTPLPVKNNYRTIKTLGTDRLAAIVGGNILCNKKNLLIIDIGTCVTYDFIDNRAKLLGRCYISRYRY